MSKLIFTTDYYKENLKINLQWTNNTDIFTIFNKKYEIIDAFAIFYALFNKYSMFFLLNFPRKLLKGNLNLVYNELYETFKSPLLYTTISPSFIFDYIKVFDMKKYILKKKNIMLFNTGINISEALLYLFTQHNIINKIDLFIYQMYEINKNVYSDAEPYLEKLNKIYEGENITWNKDDKKTIANNYNDIIKTNPKKDLIFFDYRIFTHQPIKQYETVHEKIHFICTFITLSTLVKGGTFIFTYLYYSTQYLENVIILLSKYFKKIITINDFMHSTLYIICDNFNGDNNVNYLETIIIEWNAIKSNTYITKIFDNYDTNISDSINKYINMQCKFLNKINTIYIEKLKYISTLPYLQLWDYYNTYKGMNYSKYHLFKNHYKLKFNDTFKKKIPNYNAEINAIYIFKTPINISYLEKYESTQIELIKPKLKKYKPLVNTKQKLIIYKIAIDTKDKKKWEYITYKLNISNGLIKYIKNTHNMTFTRAFYKMYEILTTFNFFTNNNNIINTLHICEAPGHFINATNYFIKSKYPTKTLNWNGNSLNPNNEEMKMKYKAIFNDAYGFIKKYPDKWLWGADNTGDITTLANIEYFKKKFNETIDLFTSDCGLGSNTRIEYHNQELTLGKANFCQMLLGLLTNKKGGSSVFKYFIPFTTPLSISLLYLLNIKYETVHIFKPLMGSPTNNEVYIIAYNKLHSLNDKEYDGLIKILDNFDMNVSIIGEIEEEFINHTNYMCNLLVKDIIDNFKVIYYYYNNENEIDHDRLGKNMINFAKQWITYFKFDINNNIKL